MPKDRKVKADRVEKKHKSGKKKDRKGAGKGDAAIIAPAFSILAKSDQVDPALESLFAAKQPAVPRPQSSLPEHDEVDDEELSELEEEDLDSDAQDDEEEPISTAAIVDGDDSEAQQDSSGNAFGEKTLNGERTKRRKRRADEVDDLEGAHLRRLAKEEEREIEVLRAERLAKRQKLDTETATANGHDGSEDAEMSNEDEDGASQASGNVSDNASPPPQHETVQASDVELSKANRTVFLGNVSTSAITSKSDRRKLMNHLSSFFKHIAEPQPGEPPHSVESLRFRSTPYATAMPKKAAYAKQEVMDATTKCTNAYAVYSSQALAREAAKHLNATIILNRHLRVDEIAHPAKTDPRRCVFVGNLGFVDDETNIRAANAEDGRETRKPGKEPADVEEGLWRTFGKLCGAVESVRVVRDSITRVGKGIAYVQFADENAVEAALLLDGNKYPPMLPRKLRVSRAKAHKRNARPGSGRPGASQATANGYQRKVSSEEASRLGRASKLFGKAAAGQMKPPRVKQQQQQRSRTASTTTTTNGQAGVVKRPENFVFEGHRASSRSGKSGLKLGGRSSGGGSRAKKSKGGKPTNRSAKRAAAYKATKGKK